MRPLILLIFFLSTKSLIAQTGIGTTTPHASAKLDITATDKGFLPPRVTLTSATDNTTIPNAAEGLLIYNKGSVGLQAGYYYWNGANWATIATATSAGNGVTASELVKLYQEAYSTTAGKASSSTGYSFTVPVSGKYEFNFNCTGWNSNGTAIKLTFNVREGTSVIGSDYHQSYSSNAWVEYEGRVEVNLTAGVTYNVQVVTTTGSRTAGYDWDKIMYKMIAGNLPVTGQTVDYVSTLLTSSQTNLVAGQVIKFQTIKAGNIPYNASTGNFTLTAGKTYRLTGFASLDGAGSTAGAIDIVWRDQNGNDISNWGSFMSSSYSSAYAGQGVVSSIYTPTSNISVYLCVSYTSQSSNIIRANATSALIEQIGSSAIINPWTLSGNDTYNNLGKVGIGNTAPTTALDVTGDTKVSGVLTAGGNSYPTNAGTNGYALTTNAAGAASWNAVPPVGVITAYAGSTAPTGYLICNGAAVSRTTYAALYAIIGTTYGTGDGSTTFNIPDLTGRVPVGKNAGTFSTLGAKAGEETHTMTVNEMPAHKHTTSVNSAGDENSIGGYAPNSQSLYFGTDRAGATRNWDTAMQSTGGGAAFNVLQPYTVINYIIKF